MLRTEGSCFIDAVEVALGCPTDELAPLYKALIPGSNPEVEGFHPSIVNLLLLEKYGTGLSEIDCIPVYENGIPVDPEGHCIQLINDWFNTHGFRCVLQGPKQGTREEHAIAFRDGKFIDPSDMTPREMPTISIRSVWVLAVPPRQQGAEDAQTESA